MVTEAQVTVANESNPQRCFPVVSSHAYTMGVVCVCVSSGWLAQSDLVTSVNAGTKYKALGCVFKLEAVKLGTSITAVSA
jgi:hypothetical protein